MLDLNNPLRAYRDDRRLSVKELADVIHISRSEMVAIEEGRRTITRDQRDALARRLSVEPEKLAYLMQVEAG